MKIEFPALQSEPLVYFLLHSAVFVVVLAVLFLALGFWFGALTWGKYKQQAQALLDEEHSLLGEIAILKRKLAEQSMKPTQVAAISVPLLTEVLPSVSTLYPERQALYPAIAALPPPPEIAPAQAAKVTLASTPNLVPAKPTVRAKAKKSSTVTATPPARKAPPVAAQDHAETAEPFGFLLGTEPQPEQMPSQSSISALTSIIQSAAAAPVVERQAPAASAIILPELDPALGLIYKEAPPEADDLTKIKGIANVLEKRLHDLGIHTYRQIAAWEDSHVREFSHRLAFKDRILREKWVDQARHLHHAPLPHERS